MRYRNLLLIVFALFVAAGVTAIIHSGSKVKHADTTAMTSHGSANVVAKNVQFTVTQGTQKKWIISADQAEYFQDRTGARLTGIKGHVYDAAGKELVEFLAPHGEYINRDSQVKLTGGVSAHTLDDKNSVVVSAPGMMWSSKAKTVLADGGVTIQHNTFGQSHASRCRFNLDLTAIALEGGVVTEVKYH